MSNQIGSAGQFVGRNIKSFVDNISDGFNAVVDGISSLFSGGSHKQEVKFSPANTYTFATSGGNSEFVSSTSTGFGKGLFNGIIESIVYNNPLLKGVQDLGQFINPSFQVIPTMEINPLEENSAFAAAIVFGILEPGPGGEAKLIGKGVTNATGQLHHLLSNKIVGALNDHPLLKGYFQEMIHDLCIML